MLDMSPVATNIFSVQGFAPMLSTILLQLLGIEGGIRIRTIEYHTWWH